MQTIQNFKSGTTNVSKFDYTYNAVGTIATWTQQADSSTAVVDTLTYDSTDQLTKSDLTGGTTGHNYYNYDPAGNRLAETTASTTMAGQFNKVNQLTALGTGTNLTIGGNTSAAVSGVTINALSASLTSGTNFSASVPLPTGTNIVSVVAQPTSGVTTTQRVQIITTGTAATALTYDANGNTTTDENGYTYQWDALNRLIKITYSGGATSNFAYDGLSRRTSIIEKNSGGTVTSTKLYLWIGSEIAEERASNGTTVTKRFFPQGEQQSGTSYYYTRDHLGSVIELMSSTGTISARYKYDPYGRTTLVSGSNLATKQYAGMYMHQPSGLCLTRGGLGGSTGRPYKSNTGTWPSRDPLQDAERSQGPNLYSYVANNPISSTDSFGLMGSGRQNTSRPPPPPPDPNASSPVPATASGAEAMVGVYGYGLTTVVCCRNGKTHIMIFEKHCIGLGLGAGASTGVVTGMSANGPSCDPDSYKGGFLEYGAGPWGAGIGLNDDNTSSGKNEFNGGAMYGAKIMMYCWYSLIKDNY